MILVSEVECTFPSAFGIDAYPSILLPGPKQVPCMLWKKALAQSCHVDFRIGQTSSALEFGQEVPFQYLGLRLNRVSDRQQDYGWAIEKTKSL